MFLRIVILMLLSFATVIANAQAITISGFVMAYKGEKVMMLRKAQKNVSFDGTLGGATVGLKGPGTDLLVNTNLSGAFSLRIKEKGSYKLTVRHGGYSALSIDIIYSDPGSKTNYESFYFILKQDDRSFTEVGSVSIINSGRMNFTPAAKNNKDDIFLSNTHLMEKACAINNSQAYASLQKQNELQEKEGRPVPDDTVITKENLSKDKSFIVASDNINELRSKLSEAKQVLAKLDPDAEEYKTMQAQVNALEQQLKDKELLITLQQKEISTSKKLITFLCLFIIALAGLAFMLFYFFRQKKLYASSLNEKNQKISRINSKLLSSIRYASLIQKGFLQNKNELNQLFGGAFIYNKPKDVLSGDFYWFTKKNGCLIVAVADCTGHGVPGAMLTVLGHNALNEIVNVKGEVVPSRILKNLNTVINNAFSNNAENLEYGMDITLVSFNEGSGSLLLSGLSSGLYVMKEEKLTYHKVSPKSFGPEIRDADLTDTEIKLNKNDCLFLFSDGYLDQFSGNTMMVEKFNITRFESLLSEIGKRDDFKNSENYLDHTLEKWKGGIEQIDDILIVGLRV